MRAKKPHFFHEEVYGVNYYFLPGFPMESLKKSIRINYDYEYEPPAHADGFTTHFVNKKGAYGIYVWLSTDKITTNNIASLHHECIHAASLTLLRAGVRASHSNDEAFSYLSTWIFTKCFEVLNGDKKKSKRAST